MPLQGTLRNEGVFESGNTRSKGYETSVATTVTLVLSACYEFWGQKPMLARYECGHHRSGLCGCLQISFNSRPILNLPLQTMVGGKISGLA